MKITAILLQNVRGFQNTPKTSLSEGINIFIGANNSGKSTLLSSIFLLQRRVLTRNDITIGRQKGKVELFFTGGHPTFSNYLPQHDRIIFKLENDQMQYGLTNGGEHNGFTRVPEKEPFNLIYP